MKEVREGPSAVVERAGTYIIRHKMLRMLLIAVFMYELMVMGEKIMKSDLVKWHFDKLSSLILPAKENDRLCITCEVEVP